MSTERMIEPQPLASLVERALADAGTGSLHLLDELLLHGFSREELYDLAVPRRTLARRRQAGGILSSEESDRAIRLARLTAMAEQIFGDDVKAHRWLRKPSPMLAGDTPLVLLKTERGAFAVEQALHRIEHGMFA